MTVIRDLADFAQDITPSWRDHIAAVKAAWPRPRHRRGSPSFSMNAGACLRGEILFAHSDLSVPSNGYALSRCSK